MSTKPRNRLPAILVTAVLTGLLVGLSYYAWTEANSLARMLARGTLLTDIRFFLGMLAVFLVLSIADRLIGFVAARLQSRK